MKKNSSPSDGFSENLALFGTAMLASTLVFILGLLVLVGWYSKSPTLIQVLPSFVPMQYNTALGFLLTGLALAFHLWGYRKVVITISIIVLAIGVLTLSQYIFNINLGLDELFMRHYIGVKTSHPGRMAPNTALCFALSGIALLIANLNIRFSATLSSLIGAIVTSLGFISLFGYLFDIPTSYSWGQLTAMAVHTSLGFVLVGFTIALSLWSKVGENRQTLLYRLPVLAAIIGLTFTACIWQVVYYQERNSILKATTIEADSFRNIFQNELKTGVLALERMADRWEMRDGIPKEEWEREATRYVNDYTSYQAIAWVNSDYIVQWVRPVEGNEKAFGLNLASETRRRIALEEARDNKTSIMTRPVKLVQGDQGILIYCPIYNENGFDGFILGVLLVDKLFESTLPKEFKDDYSIKVYNENEEVFQNGVAIQNTKNDPFGIGVKAETNFETYDVKWKTIVSPRQELSFFSNFSIHNAALLLGILLTALIASMFYLFQKSNLDSKEKTTANNDLINEVKERKKIEKTLKETSAFQKGILDGANYTIISTDVNGKILTFNKTAEESLGYTAEEVVGKETPQIIHVGQEVVEYTKELNEKEGLNLEPGFGTFAAMAKTGIYNESEWTYVRKDGSTFPITLSLSAIFDDDDKIIAYLGIGKDISQLKEAEQKIQQTEQKFQAFLENTPVVAYIKDDQYRFVLINTSFEKRFEVKAENLIGKTSFDWATKEMAENNHRLEFQVMEQLKVVKEIDSFPNDDGTEDYWMSIKFPIQNPDGTTFIGGVAIDITESKRLEDELKEARDAALDSVRLKSEFLANMSHEIRTPMNGVLGMTEILLDTKLNEEQLDYTQTIQESGESLLRIINDILDFSKIEAGKIIFETIDFNLRSAVENVTTMFAEEVERKGLEIASLVETDVPTSLQGDPGRLKQILVNLIGNAIKFTKKGSIYIKVGKVSETDTHTTLKFDVSDTGIGMEPNVKKYLFQAFVQADGSMTRKYGGTGLGLAISKQLVEIMEGNISVESELGKGSTFTFTAKFEKQTDSYNQEIIPRKDLEGLRALIVDDTQTNREIIAYQISSWGMIPSEASDANKALKLLKQAAEFDKHFDLVFLDLMMPDVSGFELAELIKEDEALSNVKMILMPSFGKRGHAQDAQKIGIDAYLIKPIRQSDLYDCIANVLGNHENKEIRKSDKLITRHTLDEKRSNENIQILIAEDNLVNQKVSRSQMNNLGYNADIAANGIEVLEALKTNQYSLILMDCQMPEMDGYETTKRIRESEKEGEHIPIIAVTANALLGEKEKCIAAGMDGYLAKPFKQHELKKTIETSLKNPKIKEVVTVNEDAIHNEKLSETTSEEYDYLEDTKERLEELKNEVGEEMVSMIVSLFIEDSFMRIKQVNKFIEEDDKTAIKSEAHSLKGSSSNVGATHLAQMCSDLEMNAMELSQTDLEKVFAKIESSFLEFFEALETLDIKENEELTES